MTFVGNRILVGVEGVGGGKGINLHKRSCIASMTFVEDRILVGVEGLGGD